jgi:hypothetical protein
VQVATTVFLGRYDGCGNIQAWPSSFLPNECESSSDSAKFGPDPEPAREKCEVDTQKIDTRVSSVPPNVSSVSLRYLQPPVICLRPADLQYALRSLPHCRAHRPSMPPSADVIFSDLMPVETPKETPKKQRKPHAKSRSGCVACKRLHRKVRRLLRSGANFYPY